METKFFIQISVLKYHIKSCLDLGWKFNSFSFFFYIHMYLHWFSDFLILRYNNVPLDIWAHIRPSRMCVHVLGQKTAALLFRCHNFSWQVILMYCNVMYYTVLYSTVLYSTLLYCTVLYCTALHWTAYCTVLYCIILNCTPQHHLDLPHTLFRRGANVSSTKKIHTEWASIPKDYWYIMWRVIM